ncbi:alpha/beta hydrolase, partial [Vibrio parahaemolyticus]|nr:alpha/beta hydrolase [Vibrio parahaemolyticus]
MNTQKVTFRNADMAWDIAALILLPEGFDESKRYPTMISVHPFGSCKEQTSSAV